jgi:hypothetical protein
MSKPFSFRTGTVALTIVMVFSLSIGVSPFHDRSTALDGVTDPRAENSRTSRRDQSVE